ncbi:T6SS phospholipase effector Tle1-like catalytic domain-containing protein [Pseudomonas sp. MT3]
MPSPLKNTSAQAISKPPHMVEGGLLPRTPKEVAANRRMLDRLYTQAIVRDKEAAQKAGDSPPMPPCAKVLHVSLFFDGTNNHEPSDSTANPRTTTNVARLYHATLGAGNGMEGKVASENGFYRYYMAGVGTVFPEIKEFEPSDGGLMYATGGENRINWGLTRLLDVFSLELSVDFLEQSDAWDLVEQMAASPILEWVSLGQANDGKGNRAAAMQPKMLELEQAIAARPKPELLGIQLYVYGFSRGAAEARTFVNWLAELTQQADGSYRFAGIDLSVEFLGIFDTVASVGIADLAPFADGHMGWANDSQRLPDDENFLKRCVHLVAAHEQRACFPLDSIRRKARPDDSACPSTYRAGTQEFIYPGMHSDVGGGYPPGDQGKAVAGGKFVLSQVALHHMYNAAYQAGAPLQVPQLALNPEQHDKWSWLAMSLSTSKEFEIADGLVTRFNTWVDQLSSGPLERVMFNELCLITGWRIDRFAYGGQVRQAYAQPRGKQRDMTPAEVEAFETLHKYQLAEDAAARAGKDLPVLSPADQKKRDDAQAIRARYEADVGGDANAPLNTNKTFDPPLEQRQLANAAKEFRRDYIPEWSFGGDGGWSTGTAMNVLLGGLIYMTNDVDEAEEYATLREGGEKAYKKLFTPAGFPVNETAAQLIALFDDQVHDSRAWFMNAQMNEREFWSDYFRYRCIFFDQESNRNLSLLARGMQVVGVGIALASIGLSVKRRNPKYLVGLFLPSLGIPVMRGKVGFPEISAFDPLTGLALPMVEVASELRAFSKDTSTAQQMAAALPAPVALTAATAVTPALQEILKAHQQADDARNTTADAQEPKESGWLDQAGALLGEVAGSTDNSLPSLQPSILEKAIHKGLGIDA